MLNRGVHIPLPLRRFTAIGPTTLTETEKMSEKLKLDELNGADENPYIVVVGKVVGMTDRTLNIRYLGLEGERTVVVDRLKFGPAGSTGVPMGDGLRAFAIEEMTCEVCENNNAGDNKKRSVAIELDEEGKETRTFSTCQTCNGRGILTDFGTNTPNIDGEHGDTVSLMEQGGLPQSSQPIFASVNSGNRGGLTMWSCNPLLCNTSTLPMLVLKCLMVIQLADQRLVCMLLCNMLKSLHQLLRTVKKRDCHFTHGELIVVKTHISIFF